MLRGCMNMQPPRQIQDILIRPVKAVQSTFCFLRNSVSIGFRCNRVLNSALVGCARCTLGFRFLKKYAHQNDPLNQGNLHELKLRLKIVRCPGIEVDFNPILPGFFLSFSARGVFGTTPCNSFI